MAYTSNEFKWDMARYKLGLTKVHPIIYSMKNIKADHIGKDVTSSIKDPLDPFQYQGLPKWQD